MYCFKTHVTQTLNFSVQFDLESQNIKGLVLAPMEAQVIQMHRQLPKSAMPNLTTISTHPRESIKITLLEIFSSPTSQLHLLLAVNNTLQHYKLSTHSDLALYSNFSNLNSWKPELIL